MTGPDRTTGLGSLLDELAAAGGAYVRHGLLSAPPDPATWLEHLAPEVLAAAVAEHEAWARVDTHVQPPTPLPQIRAGLEPVAASEATAHLTRFASTSLLWDVPSMDAGRARDLASRVVAELGPTARWWSNHDGYSSSYGLTGCTVDGLVAGTDGTRFGLLLQAEVD
ncbi:hypothetical protein ACIBL6_05620 [Streptomyces sp. NPDC050400]|uniref:hypothetical protein n=1 Tax=Streptomyces sp. NPDC050400 TaxID=3365610 RepID=UPI0037A6711F